jgi:hypothetical protein
MHCVGHRPTVRKPLDSEVTCMRAAGAGLGQTDSNARRGEADEPFSSVPSCGLPHLRRSGTEYRREAEWREIPCQCEPGSSSCL